jgi:hypothetical protein
MDNNNSKLKLRIGKVYEFADYDNVSSIITNKFLNNNTENNISLTPIKTDKGILEGKLYFRGKPCPPGISVSPPCNGPYASKTIPDNKTVYIYIEKDRKRLDNQTTVTDENGKFSLTLDIGNYIISTRSGPSISNLNEVQFIITKDNVTILPTIVISTGIS